MLQNKAHIPGGALPGFIEHPLGELSYDNAVHEFKRGKKLQNT